MRRSWALVKHEFRVLRDDPSSVVFLLFMPLIMMAFLRPVFRLALAAEGYSGANGAEQAVPGMAVMFAAFSAGYIGFGFFREHGWGTWERLRASSATPMEIMIGKLAPALAVFTAQMFVLFVAGWILFSLNIEGSLFALASLGVFLSICLLAFGVAVTAFSRTSQQLNALGSIGAMLLVTLGGALVPLNVMPEWVQTVAPIVPTYWGMEGFRSVILEGAGITQVGLPLLVLSVFTLAFALIFAVKFRFEETKVYYG